MSEIKIGTVCVYFFRGVKLCFKSVQRNVKYKKSKQLLLAFV